MASPDLGDGDPPEVSQSPEETYDGDEFLLGSQSHIEPPALPGLVSEQDLNNPFTKAGDEPRENQSQVTFADYNMPSVQSISSRSSSPTSKLSEGVVIRNLEPLNDPESRAINVKKRNISPEDMQNLQKIFAQRATGIELAPGAGDIFKGLEPADEQSSKIDEEDRDAWMNATIDVEEDDAELFAEQKAKFERRKRARKANWEDEVLYLKAESTEKARLKRLEADCMRAHDSVPCEDSNDGNDDEEELFFSSMPEPTKNNSCRIEDLDEEEVGEELQDAPETANFAKPMTRQKNKNEKKTELEFCKRVGVESLLAQGSRHSKGRKLSKRKTDSSNNHKAKHTANKTSIKKASGKKTSRKSKANGERAKLRPNQPGYLNDLGSLYNSNVYDDANSSLHLPGLAPLPHANKEKLLKALLAGVPSEDQRACRGQKANILRSTRILGGCKSDGGGKWKLKGMTSSLLHHQVQGAAWMRERESGTIEPRGGLQADQMGLGKTIMTIATMVANPPTPHDSKCTLIVCSPAIVSQWMSEFARHVEPGVFPKIFRYQASTFATTFGAGNEAIISEADVVLTSYQEVMSSYPKNKPPKEIVLTDKKLEWWENEWTNRSILHKIHFYRVVLDEAQAIKNHKSHTSVACRGLMAKHRWAITGTPIQNAIIELYPFFKFLRVKQTGDVEVFRENFCEPDDEDDTKRLHAMLNQFMIRRSHKERLFGQPIVKLPKNTQKTIVIEFNAVERAIYNAVRRHYIKQINVKSKAGSLEKSYRCMLTMLLRLRQLTAHIFLVQEMIEDCFQLEDIENLWRKTESESSPENKSGRDMLLIMRKVIADSKSVPQDETPTENEVCRETESLPENESSTTEPNLSHDTVDQDQPKQSPQLIFKFRKYLRDLAQGSRWSDIKDRSLCHKCRDVPDEPWITECLHVYCKECLTTMSYEAALKGERGALCQECGELFGESSPCTGLQELELNDDSNSIATRKASQSRKDKDRDIRWIGLDGRVLPSSKTAAVQAQVEKWLIDEPDKKIIIFSQFFMLMNILGKICQQQDWKYCKYNGQMSHQARDKTLLLFEQDKDMKIMIASLKCGGVGLNLTMASRVICVDLWWNDSVEEQAFCRVFRIGQESETFITRFVVKDTVDEQLQDMQNSKSKAIGEAIDNPTMLSKLSLHELMRLFGPVEIGDDRKPFILVDDDGEFNDNLPPES